MRLIRATMRAIRERRCVRREKEGAVGEATRRSRGKVTPGRGRVRVVRGEKRRACREAAAEGEGMGALRRKRTEASASMPPACG
jgi:hypothetical protein